MLSFTLRIKEADSSGMFVTSCWRHDPDEPDSQWSTGFDTHRLQFSVHLTYLQNSAKLKFIIREGFEHRHMETAVLFRYHSILQESVINQTLASQQHIGVRFLPSIFLLLLNYKRRRKEEWKERKTNEGTRNFIRERGQFFLYNSFATPIRFS